MTVPRVGYRLVVPAGAVTEDDCRPSRASRCFRSPISAASRGRPGSSRASWEDIVTALSRFRSFAVVARSSTLGYRGRSIDVRQVARELGVRYRRKAACGGR